MSTSRTRIGSIGEQMAARHLERAGMVVLQRNWRCATAEVRGELDIVAWDGPELVFCEVKTRRSVAAGGPLEAITPRKVAQLRRLARAWLAESGLVVRRVRIDAVGVCWPAAGGRAEITHLRGIG
jgi:putative endonuclease